MIGAVILNYACAADTVELLNDLSQEILVETVVVVDNGSPDDSLPRLRWAVDSINRIQPGFCSLIDSPENRGFSAGNNLGIKALRARGIEAILVINPDVRLVGDCLSQLVCRLSDTVAITSPVLLSSDGKTIDSVGGYWNYLIGRGQPGQHGVGIDRAKYQFRERCGVVSTFSGACFLIRANVIDELGYLPEYLFLYCEEVDLSNRLRRNGLASALVSNAFALHGRGGSIGSAAQWTSKSRVSLRSSAESAILLTRVWWPEWVPLVIGARLLMAAILAVRGHLSAASAVIQGVKLGLRRAPNRDI